MIVTCIIEHVFGTCYGDPVDSITMIDVAIDHNMANKVIKDRMAHIMNCISAHDGNVYELRPRSGEIARFDIECDAETVWDEHLKTTYYCNGTYSYTLLDKEVLGS